MSRRWLSFLAAALGCCLLSVACGGVVPAQAVSQPSTPVGPAATHATAVTATPATTPVSWAALTASAWQPLRIARNRPGIAADAARPDLLAYCVPGAVATSRDAGRTWRRVPTAGVPAATAASAYPVEAVSGQAPACTSAGVDPARAGTVYAVFAAGPAGSGMPPVYSVPVYTRDGGRTWRIVPAPAGSGAGRFGQFAVSGGTVDAVFGRGATPAPGAGAAPFELERTIDGGSTWRTAAPACPATGPCLVWGAAVSGTGSCAMHAYPQPIAVSPDGGRTWAPPPAPGPAPLAMSANGCGLDQLVALSPTRIALIANESDVPSDVLRVSADLGRMWRTVTLPPLPGGATSEALQMLPDGGLIAPVLGRLADGSFGQRLELLRPGVTHWCTVAGVTLRGAATDPTSLQAAGGRLWWVQRGGAGTAATAVEVSLQAIRC